MKIITLNEIKNFALSMTNDEKAAATIEKYTSAMRKLMVWLEGKEVTKQRILEFRDYLLKTCCASTVNGVLSAINTWLSYVGMEECRVKHLRIQRKTFCPEEKELRKEEYNRLIRKAKQDGNNRLAAIMETIGATGIRVSEVKYITVEAVSKGRADISLKGKIRTIMIPNKLSRKLKKYANEQEIKSGPIFLTRKGNVLSRQQIWAEMKKLGNPLGIKPEKIFPHNLRHLFARCFYQVTQDVVKLADVMGHSSVETTRIYLVTTGKEHVEVLNRMELVL